MAHRHSYGYNSKKRFPIPAFSLQSVDYEREMSFSRKISFFRISISVPRNSLNPLTAKEELSRPRNLTFYSPGPLGGSRSMLSCVTLCSLITPNLKSPKSVKILAQGVKITKKHQIFFKTFMFLFK